MEINYTNFEIDSKIYGEGEIVGLIDKTGNFINDNFYDVRTISYNPNMPVMLYLPIKVPSKNKKLTSDLTSELGIGREIQLRSLKKLSSSELIKVLITKLCISDAKTIILDSIDACLNVGDLHLVLKALKNHLPEIQKKIIFTTNKGDNLLEYVDRYIIVEDGKITYNGKDFKELKDETALGKFVTLANKKGASLDNYKDVNDLLKAIYRSVK